MTTVQQAGRRYYLRDLPFASKDKAKSLGCKWDKDERCWWTGKRDVAEQVAGAVNAEPAAAPAYVPAEGEELWAVAGNTYPVRDQLRALGGSWYAGSKVWLVPASQHAAATALVAAAPGRTPNPNRTNRGFGVRRSGGGRCRGCGGAVVSAPHHSAMGGYCGSCAFDEYDC